MPHAIAIQLPMAPTAVPPPTTELAGGGFAAGKGTAFTGLVAQLTRLASCLQSPFGQDQAAKKTAASASQRQTVPLSRTQALHAGSNLRPRIGAAPAISTDLTPLRAVGDQSAASKADPPVPKTQGSAQLPLTTAAPPSDRENDTNIASSYLAEPLRPILSNASPSVPKKVTPTCTDAPAARPGNSAAAVTTPSSSVGIESPASPVSSSPTATAVAIHPVQAGSAGPAQAQRSTAGSKDEGSVSDDAVGPASATPPSPERTTPFQPLAANVDSALVVPSAIAEADPNGMVRLAFSAGSSGSLTLPQSNVVVVPSDTRASGATQQVSAALLSLGQTSNGGQHMTLRLDPAELGQVEIRIDRPTDAPARVDIAVQRPETMTLLLNDQPQLQRALDQAGVPTDGRSVTLHVATPAPAATSGHPPEAGLADSAGQGQGGNSSAGHSDPQRGANTSPDAEQDETPAQPTRWLRVGLDITA